MAIRGPIWNDAWTFPIQKERFPRSSFSQLNATRVWSCSGSVTTGGVGNLAFKTEIWLAPSLLLGLISKSFVFVNQILKINALLLTLLKKIQWRFGYMIKSAHNFLLTVCLFVCFLFPRKLALVVLGFEIIFESMLFIILAKRLKYHQLSRL